MKSWRCKSRKRWVKNRNPKIETSNMDTPFFFYVLCVCVCVCHWVFMSFVVFLFCLFVFLCIFLFGLCTGQQSASRKKFQSLFFFFFLFFLFCLFWSRVGGFCIFVWVTLILSNWFCCHYFFCVKKWKIKKHNSMLKENNLSHKSKN